MPVMSRTPADKRGFTIIEMVITVAVMAILVSISMPAIFEYMRQRDVQKEDIALNEIRKAFTTYLAHNGTLPSDNLATEKWYEKLAGYTNMSVNEIQNDIYGRPRMYVRYQNNDREMFGTKVGVFYATVHSKGVNGKAENTYLTPDGTSTSIDGIPLNGNEFQSSTNSSWWSLKSGADNIVDAFSKLRPGGDDHLVRFTNYSEVLDNYNTTMQRLDTLTEALETYARSRYADRVSECLPPNDGAAKCIDGIPEQTIYYPKATAVSTVADNAVYNETDVIVNNRNGVTTRRTNMETLMDKLGLPRENCCSALFNASDNKPMPFYYFSNPMPRSGTSGACGARPGATTPNKLPARVTVPNIDGTYNTATCG